MIKNPKNNHLKVEYKKYCKILDKIIKDAKIKYESNLIEKNSNDPKYLWSVIKSKIGMNNNKDNKINEIYNDNNEIITNQIEIANFMNNYYCKMGEEMSKKIEKPSKNKFKLPNVTVKSIFIKPTNKNEILNIINSLKNKNGGVDKINSKTLKILSYHISNVLSSIFNKCIEKGIWPDALKAAEVVPIFKSGRKTETVNYRPISIISNLAKFLKSLYIVEYIRLHN